MRNIIRVSMALQQLILSGEHLVSQRPFAQTLTMHGFPNNEIISTDISTVR